MKPKPGIGTRKSPLALRRYPQPLPTSLFQVLKLTLFRFLIFCLLLAFCCLYWPAAGLAPVTYRTFIIEPMYIIGVHGVFRPDRKVRSDQKGWPRSETQYRGPRWLLPHRPPDPAPQRQSLPLTQRCPPDPTQDITSRSTHDRTHTSTRRGDFGTVFHAELHPFLQGQCICACAGNMRPGATRRPVSCPPVRRAWRGY